MQYEANSPEEYITQVPEERQAIMQKLRKTIRENISKGFKEGINYKMIGYYVPCIIYLIDYQISTNLPLPFINIASQKKTPSIYII